jgi:hypothetical protein
MARRTKYFAAPDDRCQIHRMDNAPPIAETLEALHNVVKARKARYLGASSPSWAQARRLTSMMPSRHSRSLSPTKKSLGSKNPTRPNTISEASPTMPRSLESPGSSLPRLDLAKPAT